MDNDSLPTFFTEEELEEARIIFEDIEMDFGDGISAADSTSAGVSTSTLGGTSLLDRDIDLDNILGDNVAMATDAEEIKLTSASQGIEAQNVVVVGSQKVADDVEMIEERVATSNRENVVILAQQNAAEELETITIEIDESVEKMDDDEVEKAAPNAAEQFTATENMDDGDTEELDEDMSDEHEEIVFTMNDVAPILAKLKSSNIQEVSVALNAAVQNIQNAAGDNKENIPPINVFIFNVVKEEKAKTDKPACGFCGKVQKNSHSMASHLSRFHSVCIFFLFLISLCSFLLHFT